MGEPNYHKIALNNARVIEQFCVVLDIRNKRIKSLEDQNQELQKELAIMDKAHYRCSQRCLEHIDENEKVKKMNDTSIRAIKFLIVAFVVIVAILLFK